ncbi:hypothetical protein BGZ50_002554 [Haplosporangium sp. Z 11]|nr:hypothetical protein BGZ50_002554 [Haplosporangium sp. Z 11]
MFNSPLLLDFNATTKRSKITKACDNCRRRRVKCDGVPDGCGGCKAAKTQCVYTTSNTKRGPPKGYVEVIEDRLGKIENMLAGIVKKKKILVPQDVDKAAASQSENEDNNDDDHASVYSSDLVEVKKQPSSPALRPTRSNTPSLHTARSGSIAISPLGRHSPLVSRNRSLTSLLPFSQENYPQHAQQRDSPGPVSQTDMAALTSMFDKLGTTSVRTTVPFPWLTPEQSRQYGRNYLMFTAESLEPALPTLHNTFSPATTPEITLQLLNTFFDHFNIFLPLIHGPTFMKQWQQESCQYCPPASSSTASPVQAKIRQKQRQQSDAEAHKDHVQNPIPRLSPLLLNALLAIAVALPVSAKQNPEVALNASKWSQDFFDNARMLLDDFLDVPRVSTVQALCLMSQFHHQGQCKATRSSGYLSMAIRMAHELGLNRDPEMMCGPDADSLRYLWWSMFVLDHQFSAWLGLGLLMHGKESDVELPVHLNSPQQDLRGFVCMVRLVKILGSVLQHSYSTQSLPPQFGGHDSMVSYLEGSLTSWLSNLSPDMRWQNPNGSGSARGSLGSPRRSSHHQYILSDPKRTALGKESSDIYPAYLYIVYNTTLILLHRPYIVGAAGSPAAAQSNTICTGSGRAITDIAQGLDIEQCSYVVNRFALYALMQAGVIHAMNAVYDKRGSEVAMEYYKKTVRVLESFLTHTAYSGGVTEGIKILEQFLATTMKAAAEEEDRGDASGQHQAESQPNRRKRQLETGAMLSNTHTTAFSQETTVPAQYQQSPIYTMSTPTSTLTQLADATPNTPAMMASPALTNSSAQPPYVYNYNQQQLDIKEQQKQQQLKIQQQHRMYQQMQTFGAGIVKVESKAESEMRKLEQQQQQQQQLVRQQLQRQQQRQQQEMEMKEQNGATATSSTQMQSGAMPAPVIPSHRYAIQMLQQQQQHQQQQPQHSYHAQAHHGQTSMPMSMAMSALATDTPNKMDQDFQIGSMGTSSAGYDPTHFWVDFSAADQSTSITNGTINPSSFGQDTLRISTMSESQSQPGGNPLWM